MMVFIFAYSTFANVHVFVWLVYLVNGIVLRLRIEGHWDSIDLHFVIPFKQGSSFTSETTLQSILPNKWNNKALQI